MFLLYISFLYNALNVLNIRFNRSSLFYNTRSDTSNTSETQTTRVRHEYDMNYTSGTQVRHEQHSTKSAAQVRHKCYKNDTSETRVKNFDFDNDTIENIISQPYISYVANKRLQREEQFYTKNYLLEMPHSHVKMYLKNAPQKLNFAIAKAISKGYTLDSSCKCPCIFPHNYV